jgi:hypothetical protein
MYIWLTMACTKVVPEEVFGDFDTARLDKILTLVGEEHVQQIAERVLHSQCVERVIYLVCVFGSLFVCVCARIYVCMCMNVFVVGFSAVNISCICAHVRRVCFLASPRATACGRSNDVIQAACLGWLSGW